MSGIIHQKKLAFNTVETLQRNGFIALFAGGCVRDELIGRVPKDYDVATSALPDEVERLFPKTIAIGKAFGVIAVVEGIETVDVATFRREVGAVDGRHPETVHFCGAREDALRRDFTINGMFYDPIKGQLLDYVNGRIDLQKKRIVAIGNPAERFREDHLRMLRAIRFAYNLGFELDPDTEAAVSTMAHLIQNISAERIEMELSRILIDSPRPGDALQHLQRVGLLEYILPEIIPMMDQPQPPQFHPEGDVFEHTVLMLNLMNEHVGRAFQPTRKTTCTPREMAYTVLLHDVGKPPTASIGPGADGKPRIRFDGHADVGAEMAEVILTRLKFPNKEKKHIVDAIRGHMRFMHVQDMRTSKLRKMIGAESFDLEMELHRLDCLGSHRMLDNYDFLQNYIEEMDSEPILPEPWIRGRDLLAMGYKEGRLLGRILKEAYDAQMENRFSTREELLKWISSQY